MLSSRRLLQKFIHRAFSIQSKSDVFYSDAHLIGKIKFPRFNHLGIMMMPFVMGDKKSLPEQVLGCGYVDIIQSLSQSDALKQHHGGVAYLTIDEAIVPPGIPHRNPGLHVDGATMLCGWAQKPWASSHNDNNKYSGGMVIAASVTGSVGWVQSFKGKPKKSGDCEHLAAQCKPESLLILSGGNIYWASSSFVHTTIPCSNYYPITRQFIRISPPNDNAPWYEGYTPNPLGIKPTGLILPRRITINYRQNVVAPEEHHVCQRQNSLLRN